MVFVYSIIDVPGHENTDWRIQLWWENCVLQNNFFFDEVDKIFIYITWFILRRDILVYI